MTKTILYLHGFASSSNSNKAKILSSYISKISSNSKLMIPNLDNNFKKAVSQIELLIKNSDQPISFIGSSLGGYFAAYFASIENAKAILINPAIPPLKGFDEYLGENKNYSTGQKFLIEEEDIKFLRQLLTKKYLNKENTLVLMESGDDVLEYKKTSKYFEGCHIDIVFGGSHSYESMGEKLKKISNFLNIQ
mgnify:FL=1|tara:strand:+ start:1066 stop:1641 length:576 start_codon:yes stop_codon:yes gene_type:complete